MHLLLPKIFRFLSILFTVLLGVQLSLFFTQELIPFLVNLLREIA